MIYSPPFSKSVSTNVAKIFFQLVPKHYPRSHKLHKIFNRNMKGNNKKVTTKPRDQISTCNCIKEAECPLEGNCHVKDVVYKCDVTRPLLKKCILDLQRENGRLAFIAMNYHLDTRGIPTRQHFQVTCGTWQEFQVEHLT